MEENVSNSTASWQFGSKIAAFCTLNSGELALAAMSPTRPCIRRDRLNVRLSRVFIHYDSEAPLLLPAPRPDELEPRRTLSGALGRSPERDRHRSSACCCGLPCWRSDRPDCCEPSDPRARNGRDSWREDTEADPYRTRPHRKEFRQLLWARDQGREGAARLEDRPVFARHPASGCRSLSGDFRAHSSGDRQVDELASKGTAPVR